MEFLKIIYFSRVSPGYTLLLDFNKWETEPKSEQTGGGIFSPGFRVSNSSLFVHSLLTCLAYYLVSVRLIGSSQLILWRSFSLFGWVHFYFFSSISFVYKASDDISNSLLICCIFKGKKYCAKAKETLKQQSIYNLCRRRVSETISGTSWF